MQHIRIITLLSIFFFTYTNTIRVLIGSPVYQKPAILEQFLDSLQRQRSDNIHFDYYFIDDNVIEDSSNMLVNFSRFVSKNSHCYIMKSGRKDTYICNENTHYWNDHLVWKVAGFKDQIIQFARENNYDYLFLVDSDMVIHPKTIAHLVNQNKDILSCIHWTQWQPNTLAMPNVWLYDLYTQHEIYPGEQATDELIIRRRNEFYEMLRIPGVYPVGGLCACTLISRHALETGVAFKKIKNVTFWGEDRHFCIRAAALGLELFVDTHYPSYHIYRESELAGVQAYIDNNK